MLVYELYVFGILDNIFLTPDVRLCYHLFPSSGNSYTHIPNMLILFF